LRGPRWQLVAAKATVDASDYDKRSAMHLACAEGHVHVVQSHSI
jgi:ankyrin repeat protein